MTTFDPVRVREQIGALGRAVEPDVMERSREIYAPFHEREPYDGVTLTRDVPYGAHERQRLDLFCPEPQDPVRGRPRPILLFVHGGGFVGGDKHRPGTPYHDNVALWAVRHGMVGINMTYRLAPAFGWPAGAEDVALALTWIRANGGRHGADVDRLLVLGTSAGAAHVATLLASEQLQPSGGAGIARAVLVSGAYDFTTFQHSRLSAYLGEDRSRYGELSPLRGLLSTPIPTLFVLSEFEPPAAETQTLRLIDAYQRRHGRWPTFVRLLGHNHFTATDHLNTPDDSLGRELLLFAGWRGAEGGVGE